MYLFQLNALGSLDVVEVVPVDMCCELIRYWLVLASKSLEIRLWMIYGNGTYRSNLVLSSMALDVVEVALFSLWTDTKTALSRLSKWSSCRWTQYPDNRPILTYSFQHSINPSISTILVRSRHTVVLPTPSIVYYTLYRLDGLVSTPTNSYPDKILPHEEFFCWNPLLIQLDKILSRSSGYGSPACGSWIAAIGWTREDNNLQLAEDKKRRTPYQFQ